MSNRALLALFLFCTIATLPTLAQPAPGGGPPDFSQMRQRMSERTKEMLGASDDEWKVLQPKIESIQQRQRESNGMGGMMMMFGGGGGGFRPPGAPADDQPKSEVQQKVGELRTATENKDTKPEEIKAKMDALRAAREKAKADLQKQQVELRELLTMRQEAVLLTLGLME